MSTDMSSIAELIRRAQLARNLQSVGGQPVAQPAAQPVGQSPAQTGPQEQTQAPGQVQAPPQAPVHPALDEYQKALGQPAPSVKDYHPSKLRSIMAPILGGIAGLGDPKAGVQVGHMAKYGPFDRQMSEYQQRLAQKKEAFETESKARKETALEGELTERRGAEKSRAGAEESRKRVEEGKLRGMTKGTPEYEAEIEKLKIQHPGVKSGKLDIYKVPLKNGEETIGYWDADSHKMIESSTGTELGPDSYDAKNIYKMGSEPKKTEPKPPREGEAGAIDKWTEEHKRPPTYAEQVQIHKQFTEKPVDSGARDLRQEFQMQGVRERANKTYQKNLDLATSQLDRINDASRMVDSSKPEDIALAIPKILTALVSGQGTGVRITMPEMTRMVKARGLGESAEAFISSLSGKGDLSAKQKTDLKSLLMDVHKTVEKKQKRLSSTMDEIDSANSPDEVNKAHTKYRKGLGENEEGGSSSEPTIDEINAEVERRKKLKK